MGGGQKAGALLVERWELEDSKALVAQQRVQHLRAVHMFSASCFYKSAATQKSGVADEDSRDQ